LGEGLRLKRKEEGAAAVEFAIVGSLLFMMLFGIIEFGIVFNRFQGLQAGGREGARLASLSQSTIGQIMDRTRSSVSMIDTSSANESCSLSTAGQYCITITTSGPAKNPPIPTNVVTAAQHCTAASGDPACTYKPCDLNSGNTVTVNVQYKMKITIPLWAAPLATVTGAGQFLCE
jgi:Flp pilus assembly protein TadG